MVIGHVFLPFQWMFPTILTYQQVAGTIKILPESVVRLLLDRRCLTVEQARMIVLAGVIEVMRRLVHSSAAAPPPLRSAAPPPRRAVVRAPGRRAV
jgi:hypothetical protein